MKRSAVAVLDVGKTNKKVLLYGRGFDVLAEERAAFQPREQHGIEVEDTEKLLAWFKEALGRLARGFSIPAIAVTTHGATGALLDADGKLAHPVISYTAERGAEVQEEFYRVFGDRTTLHRETCSPDVGFANVGKMFYLVKTRLPEVWARARLALFYNSYLCYEMTGRASMEPTYAGNHSYLWDFERNSWSEVARRIGVDRMFPSNYAAPWDLLGPVKPELAKACGLAPDCKVTFGIHDSNANLLPYLARGYENFLLNSSGTWCVLMRPATDTRLSDEEIQAKVFFNLDALGRPVRTCIFPAGMEYDTFGGFTSLKDESDVETVRDVVRKRDLFVIPGVMPDASAFPGSTARVVAGGATHSLQALRKAGAASMAPFGQAYYGALNLALALATRRMLRWCGVQKDTRVFIEGGFANNRAYCQLLATLCPEQTFSVTNVKEGTSFGAALTGWMLAEGLTLEAIGKEFSIATRDIEPADFGDLASYEAAFTRLAAE